MVPAPCWSSQWEKAYTVFAQSIGRSGFVRATLAPRAGMQAPVPAVDEAQWLTMTDMMGDMGAMDGAKQSGAHGGVGMDHGKHAGMPGMSQSTMPIRVNHARTEYGPSTDMHVDTPRSNLDDPGIGLRNNGRRVMTLNSFGGTARWKSTLSAMRCSTGMRRIASASAA